MPYIRHFRSLLFCFFKLHGANMGQKSHTGATPPILLFKSKRGFSAFLLAGLNSICLFCQTPILTRMIKPEPVLFRCVYSLCRDQKQWPEAFWRRFPATALSSRILRSEYSFLNSWHTSCPLRVSARSVFRPRCHFRGQHCAPSQNR